MNPKEHNTHLITEGKASVWSFFVRNSKIAFLAILASVLGGFFAIKALPLESAPEVKIPIGVVSVVYPGASPSDMEKLITDKVEKRLKGLENVKKITSTSSEGVSSVVVEFQASADLTDSLRKLRDEVSNMKSTLPKEANDPIVTEIRASDVPIVTFSLYGNLSKSDFKKYGEDLQEKLEGIPGVSKVNLSGIENREMEVLVSIQKMDGYGISLPQIVSALQNHHIDFPIGNLKTDGFLYSISLKGQFDTAASLRDLPVVTKNGQTIFLRDIAEVSEVFSENSSLSKISIPAEKVSKNSVTLQLYKRTGANLTGVVDQAKAFVEQYQKSDLPPQMKVLVTGDYSEFIRADINGLAKNGIEAVIIIFLIFLVALGWREAVLTGLTIPLILLVSFLLLAAIGETLNFLVLFALIIALGMLVDDSIVIMQGFSAFRREGYRPIDSAFLSIKTYQAPLLSSTLTNIAAFFPMMMMTGIMGEYVKHIPITINVTLFSSLFVGIMLLPAMAVYFAKSDTPTIPGMPVKHPPLVRLLDRFRVHYLAYVRQVLTEKRLRRKWIYGMLIGIFSAFALPATGLLKTQMFPSDGQNMFNVTIEAPIGAELVVTQAVTERVEKMIEKLPEVKNFVTIIGGSSVGVSKKGGNTGGGGAVAADTANISINLTDKENREITSIQIADQLRKEVSSITEAKVTIEELQNGPPSGAPIEVRLFGKNLPLLESFATEVEREVEKVAGTRDVKTDIKHGTGEFQLIPKRDRLEYYGLSTAFLAQTVRTAVFGNDSVKILRAGDEIPIVIRTDFRTDACKSDSITQILEKRDEVRICSLSPQTISEIKNLMISSPKGPVSVGELADIELHPSITTINHRDSQTIVSVTSQVQDGFVVSAVTADLQKQIEKMKVPEGVEVALGGENEDTTESFASLGRSLIFGLLMIATILIFQFNSFRQPLIILFTIPLSLIGVFFGLWIFGRNFSFPGFIGIVALAGTVIKNAIILIDRINENLRNGLPKIDAIVISGGERLEPVLLTALSMGLGVVSLIIRGGTYGDLAFVIAVGITCATVLTLVMVPIFYNWLETDKEIESMLGRK